MRIIFVPQFPSEMRYQQWWYYKFPIEFRERGFEVITLGKECIEEINHRRSSLDMFSPINAAIVLETEQIKEYMDLELRDDDVLFLSDISFPGFFTNVLYHKRPSKAYAFCHATSINKLDYFEKVAFSKFQTECSHSTMFDKIFVGSKYHKNKLKNEQFDYFDDFNHWKNTMVTYLPMSPLYEIPNTPIPKTIDIMSASRPTPQKVDIELEKYVENELNVKIQRPVSNTWHGYNKIIHSSKVLLITSHEDTFGYQIVDAIMNGCIPIARNSFAYPELLPRQYLYDNKDELVNILDQILNRNVNVPVPHLLCREQMNKFYDVICKEMRK